MARTKRTLLWLLLLAGLSQPSGAGPKAEGAFSIEILVPPEHRFSDAQLALINEVAQRWEAVIVGDIPDSDYTQITFDTAREGDYDWGTARGGRILIDRVIDDVAIIVTSDPELTGGAWGGLVQWTAVNNLPAISHIILGEELLSGPADVLKRVLIHEMGHALGFGTSWTEELLKEPNGDTHFAGPLAIEAFDAAGGSSYGGRKVPATGNGHWRGEVFGNEVMSASADMDHPAPLSAITIQAMADLGYEVDVSQADPYSLPNMGPATAVTPSTWGAVKKGFR